MSGRAEVPATCALELATPPERFTPAWLAARLTALIGPLRGRRLCLAYSGGLDSSVLLAALAGLRRPQGFVLRALHVNHGLQPAAAHWSEHARREARRRRVACEILEVTVRHAPGESLEAAARVARYAALARRLSGGEILLTAHHQEDQFETVLLALMRGSGVRGLGGMSDVTAWAGTPLVRPLLAVSRAELERFATERGLEWVEDPSNAQERFDRNYLRRRVLPLLRQRWPAAAATTARSAAHLRESRALLEQLAECALAEARDGTALRVSVLARLPLAQRRNALRAWIAERGLPAPDYARLREIAGPMLAARSDARPLVRWRGGELRRFADRLHARASPPARPAERLWSWREQPEIALGDDSSLALRRERHGEVALATLPQGLQVRYRRGGEQLQDRRGRVPLKHLLQQQSVPPWARDSVPLLSDGERIIAVADLWLHPAYRAGADARERGRFRWRRVE